MSFDVPADAYDRFMGRYSVLLSPQLADLAGIRRGQRAIDVGCGPGALTAELVERLGASSVAAADPSEPFVAAARARHPGVEVVQAPGGTPALRRRLVRCRPRAARGPLHGGSRRRPTEMARVTRSDGVIAACVWDHAGNDGPLSLFWDAARQLDPGVPDESDLAGAREGHLATLFEAAGLRDIESAVEHANLEHPTFEAWWEPFTLGVGPAGAYVAKLDADRQVDLRERCRALIPGEPFTVRARAWAARGVV